MIRCILLLVCLLGLAVSVRSAPAVSQPLRPADDVFAAAMAFVDPLWDERAALIWTPNAVSDAVSRVHRNRESGWYALGLLHRDSPGDRARAARVFDALLGEQISDPGQPWDGTFQRYPEEPHLSHFPELWKDWDANWRQFIGSTFALALLEFPDRLPPELAPRLVASIAHAIKGEQTHGRDLVDYTNIGLMHAFLLEFAGERLGRPELTREGTALGEAIAAAYHAHEAFEEFNSPTYYGVDFYGLALWRKHGVTPRLRELGAALEAALWRDTAAFYHAGLRNLCGPYDRAYGMDMGHYVSLTGLWLRLELGADAAPFPALGGPMGHAHDFVYAPVFAVLGTRIPEDARTALTQFSGERLIERPLPRGRVATAWLSPDVMLGGEVTRRGRGAGGPHNQLHPATVHWRLPDGLIGWVLLSQAPRVDARAAPGVLTVSAIGDSTFRIHAPGTPATAVARDRWALPGLTLAVASDATGCAITRTETGFEVTYREATRIELRLER